MMGSEFIDISLSNIWKSWWKFRSGKKWSQELHEFQYHLEQNLSQLFLDLNSAAYKHGDYRKFTVVDNKKREISVAHCLRYGDDFIAMGSLEKLQEIRCATEKFLQEKLQLKLHPKNNIIIKSQYGLKFLGDIIYPKFHKLNKRNRKKIIEKLNSKNAGSYYGIAKKHGDVNLLKEMSWKLRLANL